MFRFATNDDTTMAAIAAGGYGGRPSPYVVNIHYLIGLMLKSLYEVIPAVNWFTVWYLLMYGMAFCFTGLVLVKACKGSRRAIITCSAIEILAFYLLMNFFSFTVAAYALLTAGMTGIIYAAETAPPVPRKTVIVSVALIILAAMMRGDVINTVIVVVAVYGTVTAVLLKDGRHLKVTAIVLGILAAAEAAAVWSNDLFLRQNTTEALFYRWGELRSRALDCAQVPYDEELFSAGGFSRAAYEACYGAFYYIRDAVSEDKMKMLTDINVHRYNPHVIGFIKSHYAAYLMPGYRKIWQGMFAYVTLTGMFTGDKESRRKFPALFAAVISADYVYHFIQRPMLHVMMPTYVMGSLLGILLFAQCRKKAVSKVVTVLSTVLAAGTIICTQYDPAGYSMTVNAEQAEILHTGRSYMREHSDKMFFAMDPAVFAVSTDEDMWHNRYATEPYNLAGNWEIYSVPSKAMFESYGIDASDPGRELPDNEKAVFMRSSEAQGDPNDSYIIDLYKEYYDMDVRFELAEQLDDNWKVYRLVRK